MTVPLDLPILQSNAWTGRENVSGAVGPDWAAWALREEAGRHLKSLLKPEEESKLERWEDKAVGWGVVLPIGVTIETAPEPIRRLVDVRRATLGRVPIFQPFAENDAHHLTMLRDLGAGNAPTIDASDIGVAVGRIPQYLLLAGSPAQISWQLQETLSLTRFVGRLDLDDVALDRYVTALLNGWAGSTAKPGRAVVWAVHHSPTDITATLRSVVTRPLALLLQKDPDLTAGTVFLDGARQPATAATLCAQLAGDTPLFVATSSHGQTGPPDDPAAMARDLGLLVGQDTGLLTPAALLAAWQPDGAVWMAHACCSAGSKRRSAYTDLFTPDHPIGKLLRDVASLGDLTSPLPRALLGAEKPLRAFIGHVEPTFDWTLKQPETAQKLTDLLVGPLYTRLYLSKPVGMTLERWHRRAASLNEAWMAMRDGLNAGNPLSPDILYPRLAAADVLATVLLGDPTAAFP